MKELYELKDMLCEELKEYGKKKELTAGSLDVVDKLSHALKSIETIIAMQGSEGEYSGTYPQMYDRGSSYARRRRDSMGRYSRDHDMPYNRDYSGAVEDMVHQLKDMMDDAPTEVRRDIQKLIEKVERM